MPAEYGKCPSCGNRVDEYDGEPVTMQSVIKEVIGYGKVVMPLCAQCGLVLGVLPPAS